MQILVRSLAGKTEVIKLGEDPTVGVLKSAISAKEKRPDGDLRIFYNGKELSDEKKMLSECGISDCAFVNTSGKLRGGSKGDGEELKDLHEALTKLNEALREWNK